MFVRRVPFGGVELDGLIDALVFLQGLLVVRHHLNAVPVLLNVGILEQQRDIAETLRLLGLAEFDVDVVALAEALEGGQFLAIGGNQASARQIAP